MKSLPRTPCQSTASTLTATMMAKAFENNTHKRGLAEMMAPPPTPTAHQPQPPSYLDCQSLQSSLKRVRLSSSPGELRLQRDLRHMVSSGTWVPKQPPQDASASNDVWMWHPPAPPVTARPAQQPPTPHIELQQVESLRLRLTFEHAVVAWIQVPRLYPHRPPLISRIVYNNNNHNHNNNSVSSHQGIQSILVQEAPPTRGSDSGDEGDGDNNNQHNNQHNTIHCANTVVYPNWSPVQRLGDLLEWCIDVFQKQHREMYPNHHINDVSLTYSSSSLSSNSSWNNSRRSSNSSITSATTGTTCGGHRSSSCTSSIMFPGWIHPSNSLDAMDTTGSATTTRADMACFLPPNRFDVGYDRAIPPTTMEVDPQQQQNNNNNGNNNTNGGIPQQVSMMDL